MTTFQFMLAAVTGVETGKKIKTQTTRRNATAPRLMGRPKLPRVQRRAGRSPLRRRRIRQVKEMIYVANSAETAREPMALNATVEPMLMSERRQVMTKVIRTELRGIFQPGLTYMNCQWMLP
jgi:hypothetical protein